MKKNIILIIITTCLSAFFISSCVDESISSDPSLKLAFSQDTLIFDTVFTTIGTATHKVKVYNPNNKNVEISTISLESGNKSIYRLNVDGSTNINNQFSNIELRAKDSIFIFVEAKINSLQTGAPVIMDKILFNTNKNIQNVTLISYGQDMEILRNRVIKNDTTLTNTKPYLIFGDLVVDSLKTLTLKPGATLYFHDKANLVVYGNLVADGTKTQKITIRGDRMDKIQNEGYLKDVPYNFISNQWGGILLLNPHGKHKFNYVTLTSGYVGIFFANDNRNFAPDLEITNCKIHNFLKYGLAVKNGNVTVGNTEISNTGSYTVYLSGGKHSFTHCTIANYFEGSYQPSSREGTSAVTIQELDKIIPMETLFENCIISGQTTNEFMLMSRLANQYHGAFKNSYIRVREPKPVPWQFSAIRWYDKPDTVFTRVSYDPKKKLYYSFVPDSVSPARNIGNMQAAVKYPDDLNGNDRLQDNYPDAGAYEWQPTKK